MDDALEETRQDGPGTRDEQAVGHFVERFASVLVEAGMPLMPSRVFSALLASDTGRLTSNELSAQLQISPAAVSSAIRYLMQVHLATRERLPGSRRDNYRVHANQWYEAIVNRDEVILRWLAAAREGVKTLGPGTPAGTRLAETVAFFEFLHAELPALMRRWHHERAQQDRPTP